MGEIPIFSQMAPIDEAVELAFNLSYLILVTYRTESKIVFGINSSALKSNYGQIS